MMKKVVGTGISGGIALGKLYICENESYEIPEGGIGVEREQAEFERGVSETKEDIRKILKAGDVKDEQVEIFEAHLEILEDEELIGKIRERISRGDASVKAVNEVFSRAAARFEAMGNEYLAARAADVRDLQRQIERHILKIEKKDISHLPEASILLCEELTPSDTGGMDREHVAAIVMRKGSYNSHAAIIARALQIPAVCGIEFFPDKEMDGVTVYVDGGLGTVIFAPDEYLIEKGEKHRKQQEKNVQEREQRKKALMGKKSRMADGNGLPVYANIGNPEDMDSVLENDAEGIGLMRSEFLYLGHSEPPSEEKQYRVYKKILEQMKGKTVIVRTLDVGGDKELESISVEKEQNPFLGVRGIRLCLQMGHLFRAQLRALLRASVHGNLQIMFPMISDIRELRRAKAYLKAAQKELTQQGVPFDENMKVGMMMEVPAAAVQADAFAKECDFFSIGTNDLIQYTMAVDRGNAKLIELYSHYQPAVLRLISQIAKAAKKNGIPCGVCGEAAADKRYLSLLVGMGVDELSVSPSHILRLREEMLRLEKCRCEQLTEFVLQANSVDEVIHILKEKEELL